MSNTELIRLIQQTLKRPLTRLEKLVIEGTCKGQRYRQMAADSGYVEEYVKQVGAKLWLELSEITGSPITKKNLRLIFKGHEEPSQAIENEVLAEELACPAQTAPNSGVAIALPHARPKPSTFDFPSGPLPLGSALYISRPLVEEIAFGEVTRPSGLLCIKAPRRFGKTSMLQRVMAYGTAQGYRSCRIDFQEADNPTFGSIDALLRWFCCCIAHALELDLKLDQFWDSDLGSKVNCGLFLQQVLAQADTPLMLSINALERVFFYDSVAQDFLSMLRFWHERSKDTGPWQQLRLVLVYGTDSYVALNLDVSPFNVGHSIRLQPFTLAQFLELGCRYQLPYLDVEGQRFALEALYRMIAGHPYLANLSFYSLAQGGQGVPDMLNRATTQDSIFYSHLQELWAHLRPNPAALAAWQRVISRQGQGCVLNAIDTMQLESMGLIRIQDGLVYPLCDLYQHFFANQFQNVG